VTDTLAQFSVLCIYSAMGIYALAFVAFAMDLAERGARKTLSAEVPSAVERRADAGRADTISIAQAGGGTTTLTRTTGRADDEARWGRRKTSRSLRVAFVLTTLGFVFHLAGVVLRGLAAGRVPWSDMWEFSIMGTVLMIAIFLLVNIRYDLRFLGAFMTGLVLLLLGIATVSYYVPVAPLPPALQSYWLVIHVTVAFLATAFFAVGFALSGVQLLQNHREAQLADGKPQGLPFLGTIPGSAALENLAYRTNIVGFILWTFTLIAGAIWAEKAWGRYWGWDTKEVWTFIIWVIYAGYIHARATRGWRGSRSAWLAIIGFSAVMFNFGIVNIFFHGLHSYSGLGS